MITLLFISKFISTNLLNEPKTYYALIAIGMVLPFISISSTLRGYFFGKEKMIPHVVSNIIEDLIRLIILSIGIPYFLKKGLEYAMAFIVLSNIISELTSILVLFFFLPKNFKITKKDIKPNLDNIKSAMNIGIPTTGSRLIGSIGYFLEPIILTYSLLKIGFTNDYIITEYGIINGYIMPLLLLPSFFTSAISQALIPTISHSYSNGHINYTKTKIKQAIFISLLIGIPITLFFELFPNIPLKLIYNTTEGINYLRVLAPICLLFYIQSPVTSSLQAMSKAKEAMFGTLEGMILRTTTLLIGSLLFGIWGLIIATSINIIFVTLHQIYHIKKALN
jgi:stage V sporulation protein B